LTVKERQPHFAIFYNHNPLKKGAKKHPMSLFWIGIQHNLVT